MKTRFIQYCFLLAITTECSITYATPVLPDPKERIDFWQQNYSELRENDDPRVKVAHVTFKRILKAAGHRPGIEPRLFIIKENPHNITLPISIPDGWILLSKNVIDICYRQTAYGNDRLAFILAHEIAHHLEDDFWHMKFFQAMEGASMKDKDVAQQLRSIAQQSNKILAKELRADEMGIIYTMMAGYDINSIAGYDVSDSFFTEWMNATNPARIVGDRHINSTHPSAKQRTIAVHSRLQQVAEKGYLFQIGLWLYLSNDFSNAILAFTEFRKYYPGREVTHNLATSFHQLAVQHYKPEKQQLPFQMAITVDPLNRSSRIASRASNESKQLFHQYIHEAIHYYKIAISLDPEYITAYTNLGSAYLLNAEPYKAIAILQDAEKMAPNDHLLINNLGIAFFEANDSERALKYLQQAQTIAPSYAATRYNLGIAAMRTGKVTAAREHWQAYLKDNVHNAWSLHVQNLLGEPLPVPGKTITNQPREKLSGIEIGTYIEEVPKSLHTRSIRGIGLDGTLHRMIDYTNDIAVLTQNREIRTVIAKSGYTGQSALGIRIGATEQDVLKHYGLADNVYWTTQGKSLTYLEQGISFILYNDKVSGWLLYWD